MVTVGIRMWYTDEIKRFDWSDMNPIQHVWNKLELRIWKKKK